MMRPPASKNLGWKLGSLLLAILLWWKHAPNIRRLIDGTEGRIGQKG